MTVTREAFIECDHGGRFMGCDDAWHGRENQSITSMRKEASAKGWRRRKSLDLCPEHAGTVSDGEQS